MQMQYAKCSLKNEKTEVGRISIMHKTKYSPNIGQKFYSENSCFDQKFWQWVDIQLVKAVGDEPTDFVSPLVLVQK